MLNPRWMVCCAACRTGEDGSIFCVANSGVRVCSVADRCETSRASPSARSALLLVSPERRSGAVEHARRKYGVSERQACRVLKQWRGTQRYVPLYRTEEDALTRNIVALASEYGRYGYRRITALLQARGWQVGQGSGTAHLAEGRAESAAKTKGASAIVVERRVVRAAATGPSESCMELRLNRPRTKSFP